MTMEKEQQDFIEKEEAKQNQIKDLKETKQLQDHKYKQDIKDISRL